MFKKSAKSNVNPLRQLRTAAEFLALSPGASCKKVEYSPDLSVFILRLADGSTFVVAGNEEAAWDRGVQMLETGCIVSQKHIANPLVAEPAPVPAPAPAPLSIPPVAPAPKAHIGMGRSNIICA